jgi:hypothetical protein
VILEHLTCPLAFAEALAQAGQGSARLPKSYGEQAGGAFGFQLSFGFCHVDLFGAMTPPLCHCESRFIGTKQSLVQ